MSDIVERLRTIPRSGLPIGHTWNACDDAADEIERLRAALRDLLTPQTPASFAGAMIRARAALGEKE